MPNPERKKGNCARKEPQKRNEGIVGLGGLKRREEETKSPLAMSTTKSISWSEEGRKERRELGNPEAFRREGRTTIRPGAGFAKGTGSLSFGSRNEKELSSGHTTQNNSVSTKATAHRRGGSLPPASTPIGHMMGREKKSSGQLLNITYPERKPRG